MTFRELSIPGAWEITPTLIPDHRGTFFEWFAESGFAEMTGQRFDMRQANCSVSAAGVLRGMHFTQLPPGQAKYVTCVQGSVFDVALDIRLGSPTYGRWDSVLLDDVERKSIYLSAGLAHGFLALQDDSTVMYLCSAPYTPQREHTIDATDPALGIDWPISAGQLIRSDRDAVAPSLADSAGVLPTWTQCAAFTAERWTR